MRKISWFVCLCIMLFPVVTFAAAPEFKADKTYFDFNSGLYILEGNVVVKIKDSVVEAPRAKVSLATFEIFADCGVRVTQEGASLTGESVYVNGRERKTLLQGNVCLMGSGFRVESPRAEFNWRTKDIVFFEATVTQDEKTVNVSEAIYNTRNHSLRY